jgi:hypothetical protein
MGVRIYAVSILLIVQARDRRLASRERGTGILPARGERCCGLDLAEC